MYLQKEGPDDMLAGDAAGNGVPALLLLPLTLPRPPWLGVSRGDGAIGEGVDTDEGGILFDQEGWLLPS